MHKYILFFTLLTLLAACSSGTNKAAQLRARVNGSTIQPTTAPAEPAEPTPVPTIYINPTAPPQEQSAPSEPPAVSVDVSVDQGGVVVEFALLIGAVIGGVITYFAMKLKGNPNGRA